MRHVLLPGLDGTGTLLAPLASRLESLGHAAQVEAYPACRPLGYAELAARILPRLPRRGRYVLVGESFSGPVALRVAALGPRGLAGLVLLVSFAVSPVPRWLRFFVGPGLLRTRPPAALMRHYLLGPDASDRQVREFCAVVDRVAPAVLSHRIHEVLAADAGAELAACPVPAMYLAAEDDRLVHPRTGTTLRGVRPDLRLASLPGPHLLAERHPAAVAGILAGFADSLSPAARRARPRSGGRA